MLPFEDHARVLLVVHAVIGASVVGASTHLALWMRGWRKGQFTRMRAVRRFAVISAVLFGTAILAGNVIYPIYKVRVRAEYLEDGSAITQQRMWQERQHARMGEEVTGKPAAKPLPPDMEWAKQGAKVARWFDLKEHLASLGFALAVVLALLLRVYDPRTHGGELAGVCVGFAVMAAGTAWVSAVVGLVTTSYRSIAG